MQKRTLFLCASFLVVALVAGCGGGGSTESPIPPAAGGGAPAGGGAAFDMSKATATVSGKISFDGMPPANDKVQMSSDPYCQMHAADYPTAETVKVSDGGVENVIVYVSSGLPAGTSYGTPSNAVEIVQQNCHYIPHVFTIMTNQTLNVKNGDMTLHNIHVWAEKNPQFNVGQPVKDMVSPTKFATPEVPVPIRCDVHKWMGAFVGVFDNPFNTVSGSGGKFELKLPPGTYEITAWHEKFGKKTAMITVADNDKKETNFTYNANDKAAD
ncbi:MAG TPA: carboxypeptidase regulatory-like domain-containing protein [Terriglobia bacterium]|nr:carboxypeptidase regulatory-like domain-containing protein [Terriglobia bacterium]